MPSAMLFGEPTAVRLMPIWAEAWSNNAFLGQVKGSVILYRAGERAFFVYGFSKSERENIREDEKKQFKKMASHVIELSEEQLNKLVTMGKFEEI